MVLNMRCGRRTRCGGRTSCGRRTAVAVGGVVLMLASVVASSAAASAQIGTLDATVTSTGRAISQDLRTAPVRPETRPMGGEADDYLRFADAHGPRSNQV